MIDEISSIFWGLSLAFNIILLIIGLPLCLLICCCCRKHQGAIEKDIKMIAKNHNILQSNDDDIEEIPTPQVKKRRQAIKAKPQPEIQHQADTGLPEIPDSYELEE